MKYILIIIFMLIGLECKNAFAKTKPDFETGSTTAKASDWEIKKCPYCNLDYKEFKIKTSIPHVARIDVESETIETCWVEIIRVLKAMGLNYGL